MEPENRDERRWYLRGYHDGRRGPRAYNDGCVDVRGPIIVWRLRGEAHTAAYAAGFSDGVEDAPRGLRIKA
jgi:hypothetical protein